MEDSWDHDPDLDPDQELSPASVNLPSTGTTTIASSDSFSYCSASSGTSGFSGSCPETPSPLRRALDLSKGGMGQQKKPGGGHDAVDSEVEMMKERFSKLLLGEDMSGSGKGVCTAVAISNAITNLYASVFGQHLRLEPLSPEKKVVWKREMDCLLSVCDHIVEFDPTIHNFQDLSCHHEAMGSRPRPDICINLPALRKLDAMLLEILDSFHETEFWYEEEGNSARSGSFRRVVQSQRKEEKWWLPLPRVPVGGLSDEARKKLRQKRDCAGQIHKAALAINGAILAEMAIPDSYWASLPKSGKARVGETIYKHLSTEDDFSPENLLNCLNISSEHDAVELADRVEASMYMWRRKGNFTGQSKSSWETMMDLVSDTDRTDKNLELSERAEVLLFCLKQRYPALSQTSLDICKIQYNKDVGQAILESYSRVLEGLAFNTVAWIDDVLFVDKSTKTQDQ